MVQIYTFILKFKPQLIPTLFILMDIITGIISATKKGNLNSKIMREGLFNKLGELLSLCFGVLVEYSTEFLPVDIDMPCYAVISGYIVVMESISILENIAILSPKIYKYFAQYLGKLKSENSETGGEE